MNNPWDEVRAALSAARDVNAACDANANSMASIIVGRLRHVGSYRVLAELKKELRDYDAGKKRWKS